MEILAERLQIEGKAWYSSADLTYAAYGQIPLHLLTAKHCNFQIISARRQERTVSERVLKVSRLSRLDFRKQWIVYQLDSET